jgi:tocopherol O-methyltransferase
MEIIKTNQPVMLNRAKIMKVIANFWDTISDGWCVIWGPHIHHGYYDSDKPITPLQAQERLIEKLVEEIELNSGSKILDVGCGMGGSSIYLATHFSADVTGITLSQKQVAIATQQCESQQIKNVRFKIEDALTLESFADNSFDVIWSLESCEQFFDKYLFIQQAFRVLKPGGKLMLTTWCSDRDEYVGEDAKSYKKLCLAFDLPYMPTIETYADLIKRGGFQVANKHDWSEQVKKSWDIGISLVTGYSFIQLIRMTGWRGFRFAKQIKLMRNAFRSRHVRYGVFYAIKG